MGWQAGKQAGKHGSQAFSRSMPTVAVGQARVCGTARLGPRKGVDEQAVPATEGSLTAACGWR